LQIELNLTCKDCFRY